MNSEERKLLVVDDNSLTARCVGRLAERMGFGAVLASDGEEVLNRLAEERFVAVISDVEMPGLNGFELLQNIRALYPEVPVILMTALCDERYPEAARAWGAWALLEKPVNAEQLAALLGDGAQTRPLNSIEGLHVFAPPQVASLGQASVVKNSEGQDPMGLTKIL